MSSTTDREIVISRVIEAPRERVFEAFTEVRHLSRWWGRTIFPTKERRDEAVELYHAVEGGRQTLDKLAGYVAETAPGPADRGSGTFLTNSQT